MDLSQAKPEDIARVHFKYFFIKILEYTWAPHFTEWQDLIEHSPRFLLECARGHGKTQFLIGYGLWLVYTGRPIEILFFSHSEEQVKLNIMQKIDEIVMHNEYLKHLRPSSKQLWGAQIKSFNTGALIRGESFGSSTRGAHPDYIFEDDPLKDKGGMTPEEQYNYHMTAISGMAKKNTVIGVIGTPLDNGDLLEQLENNPAYTFKAYPAINSKGEALFPYLFPLENLKARELEIGSFAFSREYMLQRIDVKTQIFADNYRTLNDKYEFPEFATVRTIVDPAISEKEGACDSAVVTVGVDFKNHKWELDTKLEHSDNPNLLIQAIIKEVQKYHKRYYDYALVIEAELFQKVLASDLKQEFLNRNWSVNVIEVAHSGIQGKHERICGLQPIWEARGIHLLPNSPLISQFRYYRPRIRGFKLDGIDAFSWIRHEDVAVPIVNAKPIDEGVPPWAWE